MTSELRNQLQRTLGAAYTLERELGGGGMSRVFVAHEAALGRKVVIKVLPSELAAGVNVDRFNREIQLAAGLQHPHIVPVLSAGATEGLPFFTMPFVEGESLRARLTREGALPIGDAVSILRDVARALAYAHERGIVHRDIKPDNILLSGGSATVTDFGVAKALSSARNPSPTETPREMLTAVGMSMGTPAYMAPEQAAADPDTDHRADIYAFGATAYELLTGHSPFHGRGARALLAAHMSETPVPVDELRGDAPPALAALVMACLEKDPAARPASAAELLGVLDASGATSGGVDDAMTTLLTGGRQRVSLVRALVMYAIVFGVVALLARAAVVAAGLPNWVFVGAIVVMLLWLPLIVATAFAHRRGPASSSGTRSALTGAQGGTATRSATGAGRPRLTWRRTVVAGGAAIGLFALAVVGFLSLRALGIGPAGSLMAAGVIEERDQILVADFSVGPGVDTVLGAVVTEAFRTDLSQAATVTLVGENAVRDGLKRMQVAPGTPLDGDRALQLAQRDGIPVIVDGSLVAAGSGFMLTARLVQAADGKVLSSFRETARDANEILPAIDALSSRLRGRLGESLRAVSAKDPLEKVTTGSMEALRKYALGSRLIIEGNDAGAITQLEEAIAIDTTFAMAYRKLSTALSNTGGNQQRAVDLMRRAFEYRDRLTPIERYLTEGSYYGSVAGYDPDKSIAAYESALEIDPRNYTALNNVAIQYLAKGNAAKAEEYYLRALEIDDDAATSNFNLVRAQLTLGKYEEAAANFAKAREKFPRHRMVGGLEGLIAYGVGGPDSAAKIYERIAADREADPTLRLGAQATLAELARQRGQLADALRSVEQVLRASEARGEDPSPYALPLQHAIIDIWFRNKPKQGLARLDAAMAKHPISSLPMLQRPYLQVASWQAIGGEPDRARATLAAFEREVTDSALRRAQGSLMDKVLGDIALAEGRWQDALAYFRKMDMGACEDCRSAVLGRAYDEAEMPDSAIAEMERYANKRPSPERIYFDAVYLAATLKRLGELYDARGDRAEAAEAYSRFVELWKDADPELQPHVDAARKRLDMLRGG